MSDRPRELAERQVGFGMYAIATFATVLSRIMFTGMWYLENRFKDWFDGENEKGAPRKVLDGVSANDISGGEVA